MLTSPWAWAYLAIKEKWSAKSVSRHCVPGIKTMLFQNFLAAKFKNMKDTLKDQITRMFMIIGTFAITSADFLPVSMFLEHMDPMYENATAILDLLRDALINQHFGRDGVAKEHSRREFAGLGISPQILKSRRTTQSTPHAGKRSFRRRGRKP